MPLPQLPPRRPNSSATREAESKSDNELLFKGVLCALIGVGVLLTPFFVASPDVQNMVGKASLVGWFAMFLGLSLWVAIPGGVWRPKRKNEQAP